MWIPLHDTLIGHRKLRRLTRILNISEPTALGHITLLWLNVMQRVPDGLLTNHDAEDIAAYAKWDGDAQIFVAALIEVLFLDLSDGIYHIHDWDVHTLHGKDKNRRERDKHRKRSQPESVQATQPNAPAKEKSTRDPQDANSIPTEFQAPAMEFQAPASEFQAPATEFQAPAMEFQPYSRVENSRIDKSRVEKKKHTRAYAREDVLLIFSHYRKFHQHAHPSPQPNSIEWKAIAARMAEGYSVDDLCKAIDGCHRSPFHLGQNESGTKHTGLRIVVRDGSQVANFISMANNPTPCPTQPVSPATQRLISVGNAWLAKTENALEVH